MTPENDRKTMKDLKEFPAVVGGGESAAVVGDPDVGFATEEGGRQKWRRKEEEAVAVVA